MNIRLLYIFQTVCQYKNMTETARKLYMTQPAVSQAIADLEKELNVTLFDRINRRLHLTYAGEVLLAYSKRILSLIDEAEKNIHDIANMEVGKLRIGASTTIGIYLVPKLIGNFNKSFSNIDLPFVIDNTGVIEQMVLNNQIDLGLIEGPIHARDIIVQHYMEDELFIICSPNHRFATLDKIDAIELSKENFIIREKGSGTREVFEQVMASNGFTYQVKHTLNNTEAIKRAVEADIGIAIMSKLAMKEELQTGKLKKVKVRGVSFKRNLNLIYHKDKFPSPLFKKFLEYLYLSHIRDEV